MSILNIQHYSLLPYKNTKLTYDESKVFLDIIAECLQIDPAKRPTAESLLKTYPFNQPSQAPEALEMYLRVPNPDVFTSQFILPILNSLSVNTFHFTIGVIQALLFQQEEDEDDDEFGFPIETQANNRVVRSLFSLHFLDNLVFFVLDHLSKRITANDVNPTVTFHDEIFDKLLHFFHRFVSSIEYGNKE